VEGVKPVFGKLLGIKTTKKPPTTATNSGSSSNSSSGAMASSNTSASARSNRSNVRKTVASFSDSSVSTNLVESES